MKSPGASPLHVVARYVDGRILKGTTRDFAPNRAEFHVHPEANDRAAAKVRLDELKAVFFVKSLTGDSTHVEATDVARARGQGRRVLVSFRDGETMAGFTIGYAPDRAGFFVVPADPAGNNLRVFVVGAAVARVEFVPAAAAAAAGRS